MLFPLRPILLLRGTVHPGETKPEGPFGDHLGYYSLAHDFPVLHVEDVWHRRDAIYPFTVVGRPPQEDTAFGLLIHEITGPMVPVEIPGLKSINAVDAAGVHPLLIAIGSERYVPLSRAAAAGDSHAGQCVARFWCVFFGKVSFYLCGRR